MTDFSCFFSLLQDVFITHNGQIDLNKMLKTAKGTPQSSMWTPLEPQITEN